MKNRILLKNKGISSLETAVLIAVAVAAFLGMHAFIKDTICGKWKESADVFGHGFQYEPGKTKITQNTLIKDYFNNGEYTQDE